ncbi:MAG: fibronectin type III domain-containing protein, partial [Nitrospirota bacterium]|nr:fibronectin type III domain-containing protein [Nitrospirota bacterium]
MPRVYSSLFIHRILAGLGVWCCLLFFPNVVQSTTSDSATLQWAANQEADLAGYRIYHGTAPGVYGVFQAVGKTTTYQYTSLEPSKTHYFTI